ncbi:MAG: DUF177 domain-containing protein [Clostridia bacterium]|nr:DUF177 domain-containing protein [Clostridia bacterium]
MGPMLRGEIRRMEIDYLLPLDEACDTRMSGEIRVKGEITDEGGYMHLTLSAEAPYKTECARCLAPVEGVFSVDLERTVAVKETLTREQLEENVDEFAVIENGKLDLDETVREELILCFPMRFLCREDCMGLCPKCGRPLSEGSCSCETKEIDPRWKVLEGLFDKNEKSH